MLVHLLLERLPGLPGTLRCAGEVMLSPCIASWIPLMTRGLVSRRAEAVGAAQRLSSHQKQAYKSAVMIQVLSLVAADRS